MMRKLHALIRNVGVTIISNRYTIKVIIEHHSKSASNSLNSLEAFLIMRHHLRVAGFLSGGGGGEHLPPLGSLSPPLGTGRFAC